MPHADPDERRAYIRAWLKRRTPAQRTKARKYRKAWARKNPKKVQARQQRFKKNNPKAAAAIYSRWQKKHPDKVCLSTRRRKARKRAQIHPEMDWAVEKKVFERAQQLTRKTGILHTVDHIIPIILGGWHHHENLQVLPNEVNCRKNDNPLWEEPGYKCWRDVPQKLWPRKLAPVYLLATI